MGILEKVYENSLRLELVRAKLKVEQQVPLQVMYEGHVVGDYLPDLLVEESVVVELKAVFALDRIHRAQCINYLRATGHRLCLLLNFGLPRLDVERFAL
jgi:GxxExxY protein